MRRWLRRGLALVVGLLAATALALVAFMALYAPAPPGAVAETDRIVVLAGGLSGDGTLGAASRRRTLAGVALYRAGAAGGLHLTGGTEAPDGRRSAQLMRDLAVREGMPAEAISIEARSHSTLQNALFSQPMLAQAESLRLVTDSYHLPRAWASFAWAGDQRLSVYPADETWPGLHPVLRETAAWWANLARLPVFELASALGVPEAARRLILY